jgi:hypothetical protein
MGCPYSSSFGNESQILLAIEWVVYLHLLFVGLEIEKLSKPLLELFGETLGSSWVCHFRRSTRGPL